MINTESSQILAKDVLADWHPVDFQTVMDGPDVNFQLEYRGENADICFHYLLKKPLTKGIWLGAVTVLEELAQNFGQVCAYPVTERSARMAGLIGFEDTGKYVHPWFHYQYDGQSVTLDRDDHVFPLFVLSGE